MRFRIFFYRLWITSRISQFLGFQFVLTWSFGSKRSSVIQRRLEKNTLVLKPFLNRTKEAVGHLFGHLEVGIKFNSSPIKLRNNLGMSVIILVRLCMARFVGLIK